MKISRYLNAEGEIIEVTKEHLELAVKVKEELQKASPSNRCSWRKHKEMMRQAGFEDSDSNEAYRLMVKNYQFEYEQRYAKFEADETIEVESQLAKGLVKEVGELAYAKRLAQLERNGMNKERRENINLIKFVDDVFKGLKEFNPTIVNVGNGEYEADYSSKMLVMMSDWHIGLKADDFNLEVAKKRARKYIKRIVDYAERYKVSDIQVAGIGDLLEGAYMRPQQAFTIEFDYSRQVIEATKFIYEFLESLSQSTSARISYIGSVLGNHSRMYDKGKVIEGDSAENIIDEFVKQLLTIGNSDVQIDDKKVDDFSIVGTLGKENFKLVHGDLISKNQAKDLISKMSYQDKVFYKFIAFGHFHHSSIVEGNHGSLAIGTGCLPTSTTFSRNLGYETIPSQTVVISSDLGLDVLRIEL